jgi:hypothetical protein
MGTALFSQEDWVEVLTTDRLINACGGQKSNDMAVKNPEIVKISVIPVTDSFPTFPIYPPELFPDQGQGNHPGNRQI